MDDDGMMKDNSRIWRFILLLSSILIAAYVVYKYAS